jgi:diketogulonate reductase-like aldo/keto reductase
VGYALKIGYRNVDTAYLYGNESEVGKALSQVVYGGRRFSLLRRCGTATKDMTIRFKLRRLGLTYVDLYLIHWPVQGMSMKTWNALVQLLQEGKTRAIGVSNYTNGDLKEILQNSDNVPVVDQVEFHPSYIRRSY